MTAPGAVFGGTGDLSVAIYSVSGGIPSGAPLTAVTVPEANIPTDAFDWISVPLSPVFVSAGQQYAIALAALGSSVYYWSQALADVYPGGSFVQSTDDGASWSAYSFTDMTFRTYVATDSTPPETSITSNPANPSNSSSASFSFSGSDPGGSGVASFECKLDTGTFAACTSPQSYSSLSNASHTFQVRAIDAAGNVDQSPASFTWTVDTTPPTMTCSARPSTIRQANHKLVAITTTITISDATSSTFSLLSVTSNQADSGLGRGDVPNDIQGWTTGTADTSGSLRAERFGGNRIYTITYRAVDQAGNSATCTPTVAVTNGR